MRGSIELRTEEETIFESAGRLIRSARFALAQLCGSVRVVARFADELQSSGSIDAAQLESRILLSASPLAMQLHELQDAGDAGVQNAAFGDDIFSAFDSALGSEAPFDVEALDEPVAPTDPISLGPETATSVEPSLELVLIDTNATNVDQLVTDVLQQEGVDRSFEVHLLDGGRGGIEQISEVLSGRSGIDAIHLISHGTEGQVKLGTTWLSMNNLDGYAGTIAGWNDTLRDGADLLIYGCDLASTDDGRALTEAIGALCNCDVATSVDDTGHTKYGGDWDLEFATGEIESQIAFSTELQHNWNGKLAVINVDTFNDVVDGGDGLTSLREAILQVNAGAGGDTIILQAGTYAVSLGPVGDNSGNSGDLDILKSVTITGAGARSTIIDAAGFDRVFHIQNIPTVVNMSGLTIQGGAANHNAGGIFVDNSSTLTITDSVLQNNNGDTGGGGGAAGAIHVHGTLNADRVLFTGNMAQQGGATYFHGADGGTLTNVTINGNTVTNDGGGVWTDSAITITNSTITLNDANNGGGISNFGGTVNISNTIVAGNTANGVQKDVWGSFNSNGFNLVEVVAGSTGFGSDITGVSADLDALADNGGPTRTHALRPGSPAINAGATIGAPTVDARGAIRGATPDVGAYEAPWSALWLSTNGNVTSSGAPGLDSWENGEVIELADPNLQFAPGATDGTFASVVNLEALAGTNFTIDGLHYVTRNITLGTADTIDLQPGDLLVSTLGNETLPTINVMDTDVFLFRPDSPGDYSSGTFSHVLSRLDLLPDSDLNGMLDLWSVSLIEQDTTFGDTTLTAGDFLFSQEGGGSNDVYVFHTVDVGDGTTDGTADVLIKGNDVSINQAINGLELVETATTLGDETLAAGELLVSLDATDNGIGASGISADQQDIFRLQVSETTLVAGTAVADAALLLDGSLLSLDTTAEDLDALTIVSNTSILVDSDGDGLWDQQEDSNNDVDNNPNTNPGPDTDGDTFANYLDNDDDNDGILTSAENPDPNADGDPRDAIDTDRDGQPDYLDVPTVASNGAVASQQKISDIAGGFAGTLDDDDNFGRGLAAIGDVDGDGVNDIAVGAAFEDDGGTNRGAVQILFLNTDGSVKAEQKISQSAGGLAATLSNDDEFGLAVAGIGDIDGDGINDIAVGANEDDDGGTDRGAVYILFLNADGTVKAEQKISDTTGGLTAALNDFDYFGAAVGGIGDLDADGINDIVVGTFDDDGGNDRGAVYVLFLNADGTVKAEQKISDTAGGLTATLDDNDRFGFSVSGLGDLDSDGNNDIVVGAARDDDGGTDRGAAYVLLLNSDGTVKAEQKTSDIVGGLTASLGNNDRFGFSVAGVGDVDADGTVDIVVGAETDDDGGSNRGAAYVLMLNSNGTVKAEQKISDTSGGFPPGNLDDHDHFGSAVTGIGDLNGDGTIDLAVSAFYDDDGGNNRGAVYVLNLTSRGTIVVDTTSDVSDAPDLSSIAALASNKGADGFVSLREAITATNNTTNGGSSDKIHFNIAGAGPHTIQPTSSLPTITDAVIVDGYTQSGASANTLAIGNDSSLMIELDGSFAGAVDGLVINNAAADGTRIRGLVINRFGGDGIEVNNADNVLLQGNFIGTNVAGTADLGNAGSGIEINSGSTGVFDRR